MLPVDEGAEATVTPELAALKNNGSPILPTVN